MHTKYKGIIGELIASVFLLLKGYRILETRYKTKWGEIDIIAKKRNVIVFVEVKSRKSDEKCYNAIVAKQLQRIQNASLMFMNKNRKFSENQTRYDVILISKYNLPIHVENVTM
jgi:putative endonuclease